MTTGAWIAIVAVATALAFGLYRSRTEGRFARSAARQPAPMEETSVSQPLIPDVELGDKATLVQFSSAFCAPCRATRRTLSEIAEVVPGVRHVEIDAELHLDLVRRLAILRTPTTLVLDATGREVTRATGAPRKEQVLAALGRA